MKNKEKPLFKIKGKSIITPRCGRCHNPVESDELHSCPYQCEINDDDSDHCSCCDSCTHECAQDI